MGLWREGVPNKILRHVVVFRAAHQDAIGMAYSPTRTTDLLVVVDDRRWPLDVDDESEIRFVETHPEREGGHQRFDLVAE
jgi:hypothetical protein